MRLLAGTDDLSTVDQLRQGKRLRQGKADPDAGAQAGAGAGAFNDGGEGEGGLVDGRQVWMDDERQVEKAREGRTVGQHPSGGGDGGHRGICVTHAQRARAATGRQAGS